MTDKKIEDYLERARKIVEKISNTKIEYWSEDTKHRLIEIAKMIQLEDHRKPLAENYPISPVSGAGKVYKLSRELNK